ncbi:hypothetical protein [Chitinophaga solisilvae]|uniref:Uncharacterized protein n=1 Tax=Chitinophaga solisilvae TaxID=1233460 RepID=A0A3S1B428_9BACT|nr:hypothetical protein [Chitinophaga solisilvae]NSL85745.1 hypothetical protein [Chitinophaga solisilvae]
MKTVYHIVTGIWQKDKFFICVFVVLMTAFLLSNHYGYRICNCASTEKWEPGGSRNSSTRRGVNHFYHK